MHFFQSNWGYIHGEGNTRACTDQHTSTPASAAHPTHQKRITTCVKQRRMLPAVGQFCKARCRLPEPTVARYRKQSSKTQRPRSRPPEQLRFYSASSPPLPKHSRLMARHRPSTEKNPRVLEVQKRPSVGSGAVISAVISASGASPGRRGAGCTRPRVTSIDMPKARNTRAKPFRGAR